MPALQSPVFVTFRLCRTEYSIVMHQYRFISHTADISIEVEADTLEELFLASLLGMNQVLKEDFCLHAPAPRVEQEITIRSVDNTTLLVDFLSAVLTHTYLEKTMFCRVEFSALNANYVQATIKGVPVDSFEDDIKAVTYHGAEVIRRKDGSWSTAVVFDI